ncbi:MAG: TIGR02281 family clan AA aspartic protease, partial [Hyphomicrobiales bacterium]|nr:TIGR02281 family clan AA aspartic protease [Hyphomicrobiales bacterium]
MAFWGGMRRAFKEAGLWLAAAGTAIFNFYFFEDTYRVIEHGWPKLQASIAGDHLPRMSGSDITNSIDTARSTPASEGPARTAGLRLTDTTDLDDLVNRVSRPERRVKLTANDYGHFVAQAEINGTKVELLTDTGATYVALNYKTARSIGLRSGDLQFTSQSSTANGIARVAPITIDYLRIGSIVLYDVEAVVAEPGKMPQNLLGMSFIRRLAGFELSGNSL